MIKPLTLADLNPHNYECTGEQKGNLAILLDRLNVLQEAFGSQLKINSGLRSEDDQKRINPKAPKSKHLLGQAADIHDPQALFWSWCMNNMNICEAVGVWFESHHFTPGWVHCQVVPPRSGNRIFIP